MTWNKIEKTSEYLKCLYKTCGYIDSDTLSDSIRTKDHIVLNVTGLTMSVHLLTFYLVPHNIWFPDVNETLEPLPRGLGLKPPFHLEGPLRRRFSLGLLTLLLPIYVIRPSNVTSLL